MLQNTVFRIRFDKQFLVLVKTQTKVCSQSVVKLKANSKISSNIYSFKNGKG